MICFRVATLRSCRKCLRVARATCKPRPSLRVRFRCYVPTPSGGFKTKTHISMTSHHILRADQTLSSSTRCFHSSMVRSKLFCLFSAWFASDVERSTSIIKSSSSPCKLQSQRTRSHHKLKTTTHSFTSQTKNNNALLEITFTKCLERVSQ